MLSIIDPRTRHPNVLAHPGLYGVAVIGLTCALVLALGALISEPSVSGWYADITKPSWTPPEWVFGPAWAALYAMTAVAASIVWLSRTCDDVCCPLAAFGVQLLLNLTWSVCFFALNSPLLGFLDVCLLWVVVAITTAEFFVVSRAAGWLMVPYWGWVTVAAALNGALLLLD